MKAKFIACFLRDVPPESALDHYALLQPYRDMIVGIGLDSNEFNHPPSLFQDLYLQARNDGFKLTCHCDVAQPDTLAHIHQVVTSLGGTGAERVDHGLDAASSPELVQLLKTRKTGMTLCPWAYVRHHTETNVFGYLRTLWEEGVKIMISSDSPVYVEDNWLIENLKLTKLKADFGDEDILKLMRNAVEICWADEVAKSDFRRELNAFASANGLILERCGSKGLD